MSNEFAKTVEAINAAHQRIETQDREIQRLRECDARLRAWLTTQNRIEQLESVNKRLAEQLAISTTALNVYANRDHWESGNLRWLLRAANDSQPGWEPAEAAIAQINGSPATTTAAEA